MLAATWDTSGRGASGWNVLGLNLARELKASYPQVQFVSLVDCAGDPVAKGVAVAVGTHVAAGGSEILMVPFPVVFDLANDFQQGLDHPSGTVFSGVPRGNSAIAFMEREGQDLTLSALYDGPIFLGSSWLLASIRRASAVHPGYHALGGRLHLFLQGVSELFFAEMADTDRALPVLADLRKGLEDGRQPFVVFSGGKVEFRKGQDLVLSAFKRFYDAMVSQSSRSRTSSNVTDRPPRLLTVWYHHWPDLVDIDDPRAATFGRPQFVAASDEASASDDGKPDGTLDIGAWVHDNGVDPGVWVDPGKQSREEMRDLLRHADVAIFPNRCEGGNNLVAMEAIASGVPTIISANTGHKDIIAEVGDDTLYTLESQRPTRPTPGHSKLWDTRPPHVGDKVRSTPGAGGWGESDLKEIVAHLQSIAAAPGEARRRAKEAKRRARGKWLWSRRVASFMKTLEQWGSVVL